MTGGGAFIRTRGISFIEFSGPQPERLETLFEQMHFTKTGHHAERPVSLYTQGNIRFISNPSDGGNAEAFRGVHGRGVCAIGFQVDDSQTAYEQAIALGAKPAPRVDHDIPAIRGVGESLIYLVDPPKEQELLRTLNYSPCSAEAGIGLFDIDHLTHNLRPGGIAEWRGLYQRVFGFESVTSFDIQGKQTGLVSEVIISPSGDIKIPLNESKDDKSQIAEFIDELNGEGVQHIALTCSNIYTSVSRMRDSGIAFQETLDSYYDLIEERLPGHREPVDRLKELMILIDGGPEQGGGILLQIFAKESIGPVFFEYIQRKGNEGFGRGNFQALFDAIELDQQRRGVI